MGHGPARMREDLRARMPEPGEAEELKLAAVTPVFEIVRVAYAETDQPLGVAEMVVDASSYVRQRQKAPEGQATLRERVAVEHVLAPHRPLVRTPRPLPRHRKNLLDLRWVVHNLHIIARQDATANCELAA